MNGWLIVNGFLKTAKYTGLVDRLTKAAADRGIKLITHDNTNFVTVRNIRQLTDNEAPDFVLFWDKDIRLCQLFEEFGLRTYNTSSAIEACDDKSLTYIKLRNSDIPVPETVILPKVYFPVDWRLTGVVEKIAESLGYPVVVKKCFGSFGEQVWLANNENALYDIIGKCKEAPVIVQKFIKSSYGRDIRIQVVGNRAVAAMYRYSDNDFRANISNGGKMKPYKPDYEQTSLAVLACKALGLDFAGVDILFGENGEPILCEVNSNAHFVNISECTGVDVAACIIDYIRENTETAK